MKIHDTCPRMGRTTGGITGLIIAEQRLAKRLTIAELKITPGRIIRIGAGAKYFPARNEGTMKRIAIAILFGLVAGVICATGGFYAGIMKFSVVTLV